MPRIDLAGWALLLIAMAIGYIICLKASKESSKLFKLSGTVIGIIVVVASLILAVTSMVSSIKMNRLRARRRPPTTRRTSRMPTLPGASTRTAIPTRRPAIPKLPKMPTVPAVPEPPAAPAE